MARNAIPHCLALLATMAIIGTNATAYDPDYYEIGDKWVYDLTMEIDPMTLTGTIAFQVDGLTTETLADKSYEAYDMDVDCSLSITGEFLGSTIEGTATIVGEMSVDVQKLDTIRSDQNMSIDMIMEGGLLFNPVEEEMWEHTIKTYSPPGGVGEIPEHPTPGTTWTITYTTHSDTTAYEDEEISTDSEYSTETREYTYFGLEAITVPAGTFECEVTQYDDGESVTTLWHCDLIGNDVKQTEESDDGTSTAILTSYTFTPKDDSETDDLMLYLLLGGAVVAVVAITAAVIIVRRRRLKAKGEGAEAPPEEIQQV